MHVTGVLHVAILVDALITRSLGSRITIGAVMPFDSTRLFSVPRVRPAAAIAMTNIKNRSTLHDLGVSYRDSQCDESYGMNNAIDLYIQGQVNVFFGPVCDYSAAPVARQTRFWNVPMVSIGTIAQDFKQRRSTTYPLLTRAGPVNLGSLSNSFTDLFASQRWTKVKVIYDTNAFGEILTRFCHLAAEILVTDLPHSGFTLDYYRLVVERNKGLSKEMVDDVLFREIGNSYGGEACASLVYCLFRALTHSLSV